MIKPIGLGYELAASPIASADHLRRALWDRCFGAVLASATLTVAGRFDRFRAKSGLSDKGGTQYLRLPSPFDYQKNAVLCVPWMHSDGGQADAHTAEITAMLPELLAADQSALVL